LSDYVLRTSQAVRAVKRSREGALHTENATIRSVARDSKVVYYQWIRAQGVLLVARQATEQARGHHQDSMYAFSAGTASKADVLRAEGQLRSAELFESRAASHVKLLASQLSVMMGDPPGTHYEVGENILAPLPEPRHEADERAAYEEALAQRLEFKALQASEDALRDQATLVRVGGYPRLDAQANAQYSNPNPRIFPQQDRFDGSWDVGVVLSWTPTALFGTEAQSDGFVARANELSAQRRQMQEALRLELVRVQSALSDARTATVSAQQILAAAEEGYRVRRELFRVGRATAVEVTDAETELMRARLELVNAHVDLRIARVEFDHVLGRGPAP
jgi:outer membrane protein TolC